MDGDRQARYKERQRKAAQDIMSDEKLWPILKEGPVDLNRRLKATESFRAFCETYGTAAFTLSWSPAHLVAIEKIEMAVKENAKFALAMPRGSGKSTLAHWGMLWAVMCGHSNYAIYVGATASASSRRLDNLKKTVRFNELFLEDFPELIVPVKHARADSRKALGQTFNGESTSLIWAKEKIVLPTLDGMEDVCPWFKDVPNAFGGIIDCASIDAMFCGPASRAVVLLSVNRASHSHISL